MLRIKPVVEVQKREMLSGELFRAIVDDREREVVEKLRVRQLLGRRAQLRWHYRPALGLKGRSTNQAR